jgi:hypothetical protein
MTYNWTLEWIFHHDAREAILIGARIGGGVHQTQAPKWKYVANFIMVSWDKVDWEMQGNDSTGILK